MSEAKKALLKKRIAAARRPAHNLRVITKRPDSAEAPLSFAQERHWFLSQLEPDNPANNRPFACRFRGRLDISVLEETLTEIIRRHEILRVTFQERDGRPVQLFLPSHRVSLPVADLSHLPPTGKMPEVYRRLMSESKQPIDLTSGPLFRTLLLRLDEADHILLVVFHHMLFDAWSCHVLLHEIGVLYTAFAEGKPSPLHEPTVQYSDFAHWQRRFLDGGTRDALLSFWKKALAGAPSTISLPTDHPRLSSRTYQSVHRSLTVPHALSGALKTLSRREGVSFFVTLLAAFNTLLHRYSNQDDLVVGSPVAGRPHPEIQRLIGYFVNTIPLRNDLSGDPTFRELLHRTKVTTVDALSHQDLPFEKMVEALNPKRDADRKPLFQVMFNFENVPRSVVEIPGLIIDEVGFDRGTAPFDLGMEIAEKTEGVVCTIESDAALFETATAERMLKHYEMLLQGICENPDRHLSELPIITDAERRQLLVTWNEKLTDIDATRCIHQLFEHQAAGHPDAVALSFEDRHVTYRELNGRANRLARHLVELGVVPDSLVAVGVERSIEMVVGLLAVLKAGGAYLPLDPAYPTDRLAYMLKDAAPMALLTQSWLKERWGDLPGGLPVIELDREDQHRERYSSADLNSDDPGVRSHHLAYVIYTSGSTGEPKGVMVEHRNVTRLFSATQQWFHFDRDDVWTLFHSFAFDFSVWEIWGALLHGGRLVIVPRIISRSPEAFHALLCREKVTILNQTPSAFRQLMDAQARSMEAHTLRSIILGGEALDVRHLKPWYERNGTQQTRLVNMYGITETTVHVTNRLLAPADTEHSGGSPIGSRIPDLRIYILDAHRRPVPVGLTGEIYVGGAGVARGYLNRPELTAERFLPDPFVRNVESDARMYKTGDLGKWMPDGTIEFLGRNDFQVKVRGFRIELGEIEAELTAIPGVGEAVVLAREDNPGDQRLVAYYTVNQSIDPFTAEYLRRHLASRLPDYMLPSSYVAMERFPLTPNGKTDRKALLAPGTNTYGLTAYEAPVGELEKTLAQIWSELLDMEQIGRSDNFFFLGGHSLQAVRMIERLRRKGLHTDVQTLFSKPTLMDLAASIGNTKPPVKAPPNLIPPDCDHITPGLLPLVALTQDDIDRIVASTPGGAANIQDIYPLAPLQEGILFHHLMNDKGDVYLLPSIMAFDSRELLDGYLDAVQAVIDRHDILRTAVLWEGFPEPVQVVWRKARMAVEEVPIDPLAGDAVEQLKERFDRSHTRIDIRKAPMMVGLITCDNTNDRWLLTMLHHHLVEDHTSMEIFAEEVRAHLTGRTSRLPDPLPFRNLVAQERLGVSREAHEAFFRKMLKGVEAPTVPFGLKDVQGDGSEITEASLHLDAKLSRRVREHARILGVSAASVFHLAWARLLACLSGRDDVVFGTVLFGRMQGGPGADRAMGMYINTLPVRIEIGNDRINEAVQKTHQMLAELLRHEHAPLVLAQRCSDVPASMPLFASLINYRYTQPTLPGEADAPLKGMKVLFEDERTNYPLVLSVDDMGEGFTLTAKVQTPFEPMRVSGMMNTVLENLATALEQAPHTRLEAVEVLSPDERCQVLFDWNATEVDYPKDRFIHLDFEVQAEKTPEVIALIYENEQLTYAELNRQANRLAHQLIDIGVRPDSLVAIGMGRSIDLVVALLAVLKTGGAYVPLDPTYPADRLAFMLRDCSPMALLTHSRLRDRWGDLPAEVMVIEMDRDARILMEHSGSDSNPAGVGLMAHHLAYVIYTSGSTGTPKGVMIEHGGLNNLIRWYVDEFDLSSDDAVLVATSFSFDMTQRNVLAPLTVGACVQLAPQLFDPGPILRLIQTERTTMTSMTPSMFHAIVEADGAGEIRLLKRIVLGGEPMRIEDLKRIPTPRPEFVNAYGPTECTAIASCHRLSVDLAAYEKGCIPIGRPIANMRIYILDVNRKHVPAGVIGELYIGGLGVARGYLNRPELTTERFLPDPFARTGEPGGRMYKTGDLGRQLPDGAIEFLGRNDFQVKIRGFRIELGEIEATLAAAPDVGEVAVLVREDSPGDKRLVAYYTIRNSDEVITAERLRSYLSERLPGHMIPSSYVALERFPLTPSGKVDRNSLPALEKLGGGKMRKVVAPGTSTEETITIIWSLVLNLDHIGIDDNFFDLGGHSLMATRIVAQINAIYPVQITLADFFSSPTIAALSRLIDSRCTIHQNPNSSSATCEDQTKKFPLSFSQQRLWFLDRFIPNTPVYNIVKAYRFREVLNISFLEKSIIRIIQRHDILRTTFSDASGEPLQIVSPHIDFKLQVQDLSHLPSLEREEEVRRLFVKEYHHNYDLSTGPLLRALLLKVNLADHLFILSMHHIITDGWSVGIFFNELKLIYDALCKGVDAELPALPLQFADFSILERDRMRDEKMVSRLQYWKQKLHGVPAFLKLPYDRPRSTTQAYEGAALALTIPKPLTEAVIFSSRVLGVTPFMSVMAVFQILLFKYSGQEDIVVGTPVANRNMKEIESLIGFFVNTLAIRSDLSGDPDFRSFLIQLRETALDAYAHQEVPFERIVEALQPKRDLSHHPIFQVLFAYQNTPRLPPMLSNVAFEPVEFGAEWAKFDLELHLWETPSGFNGIFIYSQALFDKSTIRRMADHFVTLLEAVFIRPEQKLSELNILTTTEENQLLDVWNDTRVRDSNPLCCHKLFERQVEKTPGAVALRFGDARLSYEELNRRANWLAHYLCALGVGADVPVGICIDRSLDLFIGVMGILKAGGAYVPLDPAYPTESLIHILSDSGAGILLSKSTQAFRFPDYRGRTVLLDRETEWMNAGLNEAPACEATAENLAYLLYTSGSTGKPKGVAMAHSPLSNLVSWQIHAKGFEREKRTLQFAPLNFDVSFQEMFATWCTGGTLLAITDHMRRDAHSLLQFLETEKVQRLFLPYVALQNLAETAGFVKLFPSSLEEIITAGEQLHITPAIARFFNELDHCTLHNQYGPTESHVVSSFTLQGPVKGWPKSPPIGRPIDNVRLYVLDRYLKPVPIGASGELHIGGKPLARGYFNRPELTEEKFISDPFSDIPGARMYKTGDLVRYLPDGNLEFLGRMDNQVKIRGYRIEPGEVESVLGQHPKIRACAVLAWERVPGDKRLVGYVAPYKTTGFDPMELRRFLQFKLPEYMIPSSFVEMETLPTLPNGKTDRRALPLPGNKGPETEKAVSAPGTDLERAISEIWSSVLDKHNVGMNEDFFDLGGHSLMATRIVSRVYRELGITIPLRAIFENSTVSALAEYVEHLLALAERIQSSRRVLQGKREEVSF